MWLTPAGRHWVRPRPIALASKCSTPDELVPWVAGEAGRVSNEETSDDHIAIGGSSERGTDYTCKAGTVVHQHSTQEERIMMCYNIL